MESWELEKKKEKLERKNKIMERLKVGVNKRRSNITRTGEIIKQLSE